jgi:hypothetical protein
MGYKDFRRPSTLCVIISLTYIETLIDAVILRNIIFNIFLQVIRIDITIFGIVLDRQKGIVIFQSHEHV